MNVEAVPVPVLTDEEILQELLAEEPVSKEEDSTEDEIPILNGYVKELNKLNGRAEGLAFLCGIVKSIRTVL